MPRFTRVAQRSVLKLLAATSLTAATLLSVTGCEVKSFIDPSELGRYNQQPLLLPILRKLDTGIEEPNDKWANATDPLPSDFVKNARDYVIGPGDLLNVSVSDLTLVGQDTVRTLRVSDSGLLNLPLLDKEVNATGVTEVELQRIIRKAYADASLVTNAQVQVTVIEARAKTFSVYGAAVVAPGEYQILKPDFSLFDALILARTVSAEGVDYLYIIRKDPVKAEEPAPTGPATTPSAPTEAAPTPSPGPDILAPRSQAIPSSAVPRQSQAWRIDLLQPKMLQVPADPVVPPAPGVPTPPGSPPNPSTPQAPGMQQTPGTPPIPGIVPPANPNTQLPPPGAATQPGGYSEGRYVIIDGKPVLIGGGAQPSSDLTPTTNASPTTTPGAATSQPFEFQDLTPPTGERIIRIPFSRLNDGDMRYNIFVRPGDVIVIPGPEAGFYYMGGHVARTGTYSLSGAKVTLKQAIIAAGMLDGVAIPQRTDIVRRIGTDREVFARVNLAAIFEGKQPDIFLKPHDTVMVGTNFFAPFLAAIRNGFRFSYGFGFFYDRNFNDDNNNNNN